MNQLRADDISYQEIKRLTIQILEETDSFYLPINIDHICNELNIKITPYYDFPDSVLALMQMNFLQILFNHNTFNNDAMERRFRFSFAHELGHLCLHRNFVNYNYFDDPKKYFEFYSSLDDYEYAKIERQADLFAALLLVPDELLEQEYNALVKKYGDFNESFLINELSNIFNVSKTVIKIRLKTKVSRLP